MKYRESLVDSFIKIITRETAKYNLKLRGTEEFREDEGGTEPLAVYAYFFRMKNS